MTDLEMLLSGSLQISKMQQAIDKALPLMRIERDSLSNASVMAQRRAHWATHLSLRDEADRWTAAIAELEACCE